jgi:hypothetical protein
MICRLRAWLRNESGIVGGWLLAALGTAVVMALIAVGQRKFDPASTLTGDLKDCVVKARAAIESIQKTLVEDPNRKFGIDDPNAVVLERCQNLLKQHEAEVDKAGISSSLLTNTFKALGQCAITEPTKADEAIAGQEHNTHVIATIPFGGDFGTDFSAAATLSGGGVSAATGLRQNKGSDGIVTYVGDLTVAGAASKNVADGATTTVTVTASGTALEGTAAGGAKPITPRSDGTCPLGLQLAGGVCRITCSVSTNAITWKVPPPIEATLTPANLDDTHATLTWDTKNAKSVRLQGPGIPGGSARLNLSGSYPVMRLSQDDTYTLTASAPNVSDKIVTAKVEAAKGAFVVTLSSGGDDFTTDSTVNVGGKVSSVSGGSVPAGTVVAVGVNGNVVARVGVDGSGFYSATITLPRTTSIGSLVLTNPSRNLTVCGSHPASVVTLANNASPAAVQNFVNAAVVKDGGGIASNDASLVITHVVKVLSATVTARARVPTTPSASRDGSCARGETPRSSEPSPAGSPVRAADSRVRRWRASAPARPWARCSRMPSGPSRSRSQAGW